jgi:hypothetical protein
MNFSGNSSIDGAGGDRRRIGMLANVLRDLAGVAGRPD